MEPVRKCLSFSDVSEATIPLTPANIWLESGLVLAGSSGLEPVKLLAVEQQRLDDPVKIQLVSWLSGCTSVSPPSSDPQNGFKLQLC